MTADGRFDEVACRDHVRQLERLADGTLGVHNGVMRSHRSSSTPLSRGSAPA